MFYNVIPPVLIIHSLTVQFIFNLNYFSFDLNCKCKECPHNGYCSDRREFGQMTFADALQKCNDEGLELPIETESPGALENVLGGHTLGAHTTGGLGIWLGIIETQHPAGMYYFKRLSFIVFLHCFRAFRS